MTLTVTRIRLVELPTPDRNGNPRFVESPQPVIAEAFAPNVKPETSDVTENVAHDGGTLYFRGSNPPEVHPTDLFVVRGERYNVDGPGALWQHVDGRVIGSIVALRRADAIAPEGAA